MSENIVLCGASSYKQKYYFNKEFDKLPDPIKKQLQIICVTFTEEVGGVLLIEFDEKGSLQLKVQADDSDYMFDEIESNLQIGRIQKNNEELFKQLEVFYQLKKCNGI